MKTTTIITASNNDITYVINQSTNAFPHFNLKKCFIDQIDASRPSNGTRRPMTGIEPNTTPNTNDKPEPTRLARTDLPNVTFLIPIIFATKYRIKHPIKNVTPIVIRTAINIPPTIAPVYAPTGFGDTASTVLPDKSSVSRDIIIPIVFDFINFNLNFHI